MFGHAQTKSETCLPPEAIAWRGSLGASSWKQWRTCPFAAGAAVNGSGFCKAFHSGKPLSMGNLSPRRRCLSFEGVRLDASHTMDQDKICQSNVFSKYYPFRECASVKISNCWRVFAGGCAIKF